jgi:hypothetical protein
MTPDTELQPLVGETEEVLHHGRPDYATLECPRCGNTEDFIEYAYRATTQRFHKAPKSEIDTEPDWLAFDYGDDVFPETIACEAVDDETGEPCTQAVWNWKDGNVTKAMMEEEDRKEKLAEAPDE